MITQSKKAKQPRIGNPELLASIASLRACSSVEGIRSGLANYPGIPAERRAANSEVESSTLSTSATLISPTRSANCSRGLASGEPKAELLRLTAILDLSPGESKVQSDLSQLQNRNGISRFLRTEQGSALQVPEVREAICGTARKAA